MLFLAWCGLVSLSILAGILFSLLMCSVLAESENDGFVVFSFCVGPFALITGYLLWYNLMTH